MAMKIQCTWLPQVSCRRGGLQVALVYKRRRYDMEGLWLRGFYADVRSGFPCFSCTIGKWWSFYGRLVWPPAASAQLFSCMGLWNGLNYAKKEILSWFPPKYHHIAASRLLTRVLTPSNLDNQVAVHSWYTWDSQSVRTASYLCTFCHLHCDRDCARAISPPRRLFLVKNPDMVLLLVSDM